MTVQSPCVWVLASAGGSLGPSRALGAGCGGGVHEEPPLTWIPPPQQALCAREGTRTSTSASHHYITASLLQPLSITPTGVGIQRCIKKGSLAAGLYAAGIPAAARLRADAPLRLPVASRPRPKQSPSTNALPTDARTCLVCAPRSVWLDAEALAGV